MISAWRGKEGGGEGSFGKASSATAISPSFRSLGPAAGERSASGFSFRCIVPSVLDKRFFVPARPSDLGASAIIKSKIPLERSWQGVRITGAGPSFFEQRLETIPFSF